MRSYLLAATFLMAAVPEAVFAAIYKCTDANGKVTFQQQPCSTTSTSSVVKSVGSEWVLVSSGEVDGLVIQLYLDIGNIRKNGSIRRANFKSVYPSLGHPPPFEAEPYYMEFDCNSGAISMPVIREQDAEIAKNHDLYWSKKSDGQFPGVIESMNKVCAAP